MNARSKPATKKDWQGAIKSYLEDKHGKPEGTRRAKELVEHLTKHQKKKGGDIAKAYAKFYGTLIIIDAVILFIAYLVIGIIQA